MKNLEGSKPTSEKGLCGSLDNVGSACQVSRTLEEGLSGPELVDPCAVSHLGQTVGDPSGLFLSPFCNHS